MIKVKDILERNKEEKDSVFIHLYKEKESEYDPLIIELWTGWLKDVPVEYMECEAISIRQSLTDLEKGIASFYIEIKEVF